MKKIVLLLTLCFAAVACKKNDVQFTYSPEAPAAGETVKFSNLSSAGEEWAWSFGDGATSSLKSPSHIYKQPGTYRVVLKVDNNSSWTATQEITVHDTVPTFVCEDSVFYIYRDYTFTANVYNPYNFEVKYQWAFPLNTQYVVFADDDLTGPTLHVYFTQAIAAPIALNVIMHGDTTWVEKIFAVQDRATNSIALRTPDGDYRQRVFGDRAEAAKLDASTKELLDAEQDVEQTYNGKTFTLADLEASCPGIKGFHIANRKIYYRANGLWVANLDGSYPVQIDPEECFAMTLDMTDDRIYWANAKGVWHMPFIGSNNNQFVTVPQSLNTMTNVTTLASDGELK